MKKVAWFSCGATSTITCHLALKEDKDTEIVYIETGSHHPDCKRYLKECEDKIFKKKIIILQSAYKDIFDVFERTSFIKSPNYAPCTNLLKVRVRQQFEYENPDIETYFWGFEYGTREENRAKRMCDRYPQYKHRFPLIENNLDKGSCLALLSKFGVEMPTMYKMGYNNNNCIGCVKGGAGYWNKIRKDFPEVFEKMAKLERKVGHHILKDCFLDELEKDKGNIKEIDVQCSIFCGMI